MIRMIALCIALSSASAFAVTDPVTGIQIDDVNLDPGLTRAVLRDLKAISQLDVRAPTGSPFFTVFHGTRPEDLMRYLRERIHYIGKDFEPEDDDGGGQIYAQNYGPSYLEYIYKKNFLQQGAVRPESMRFGNDSIELKNPRTGFMVLGPAYFGPGSSGTTRFARMETLMHEARHSDCAEVPSRADLAAYNEGRYADISEKGLQCTHPHVPCPDKPGLIAGDLACDRHAWGAYSVGFAFADGVARWCRNCDDKVKRHAKTVADDDFLRLSDRLQEKFRKGGWR